MNLQLVKPELQWKQSAISFKQEFFDYQERIIDGSDLWDQIDSYEEWLEVLKRNEQQATCDPDWVVSHTWLPYGNKKLSASSIFVLS